MRQEKITEEIRFWRRLIEKWEAAYGESAPKRMHEALAVAEQWLETAIAEENRQMNKTWLH